MQIGGLSKTGLAHSSYPHSKARVLYLQLTTCDISGTYILRLQLSLLMLSTHYQSSCRKPNDISTIPHDLDYFRRTISQCQAAYAKQAILPLELVFMTRGVNGNPLLEAHNSSPPLFKFFFNTGLPFADLLRLRIEHCGDGVRPWLLP